jgi:hypothetical protein
LWPKRHKHSGGAGTIFAAAKSRDRHEAGKAYLEQLHAELGGKISRQQQEAIRRALAMKQVEAVLKMLGPDCGRLRCKHLILGSSADRSTAALWMPSGRPTSLWGLAAITDN